MELKTKHSMMQTVYESLKGSIIYGDYTPGDMLNETVLAEFYGVSKTPIREALGRLVHEGLVELFPYKGYLVSKTSLQDLTDIFELRLLLESAAAELAAQYATVKEVKIIREHSGASLLNTDLQNRRVDFMKANVDFHCHVAQASRNGRLVKMVEGLLDQLQRELYVDLTVSNVQEMVDEHMGLVDAIEQHDARRAKELMIEQIDRSRTRILKLHVR